MKRLVSLIAVVLAAASIAFAHNGNDHIRGVVTQISAQSLTVQLANKTSKTLTLDDKTTFERAGQPAHAGDLKVGDRVIVDVPEHKSTALLVRVGAAPRK